MEEKNDFTAYEVRVYKMFRNYSIECYEEEKDGKTFTNFYITNGTQKMFCYGCQIKDREEEKELAYYIFEESFSEFKDELNVLENYYDKQMEKILKEKENNE